MATNGNAPAPEEQDPVPESPEDVARRITREDLLDPLIARLEEVYDKRFAGIERALERLSPDAQDARIWEALKPKVEAQMQGIVNDLTARIDSKATPAAQPSGVVTVGGKVSEVISLADQVMELLEKRVVPLITTVIQAKNGAQNDEALIQSIQQNPWRAAYLGTRLLPDNVAQARELAVLNAATLAATNALAKGITLGAQAKYGRLPGQEELTWQRTPSSLPLGSSGAPSPSAPGSGSELRPAPSAPTPGVTSMHVNNGREPMSLTDLLDQI